METVSLTEVLKLNNKFENEFQILEKLCLSIDRRIFTGLPHKGWDWKDDLNLFKYDYSQFELSLLSWMWSLKGLLNNLANKV